MSKPKLGLFFGSFDPPHIGHLNIIFSALNNGIDVVAMIPAYQNPFKSKSTDYKIRLDLCKAAIKGYEEYVWVDDIEATIYQLFGSSKTANVLEEFQVRYGDDYDLVIITTLETYNEIPSWYQGEFILANYNFMVCYTLEELQGSGMVISHQFDTPDLININRIDCSSTMIRKKVKIGEKLCPFVSKNVNDLILKYKLYEKLSNNS